MATKKPTTARKAASAKKAPVHKTTTNVTTVSASTVRAARVSSKSWWMVPEDRNTTALIVAAIAELLGTFVLVMVVLSQHNQPVAVMFAAVAIVLGFGALTGGYFNPALTIGAWVTRRLSGLRGVLYIVAQVLGGMLALVVTNAFVNDSAPKLTEQAKQMGQTVPQVFRAAAIPSGHEWLVLLAELLGTAVFAFIVASAISEKRKSLNHAITYGFGLFAALIVAGTATATLVSSDSGLSFLNPAVAIAAQIFSYDVVSWWSAITFLIVPLIGGVVGFGLYELLKPSRYTR
ncbi:MAG TPA: aquaporin [Candidatus Saccharimonadaceae bacterium]|nr:aquaporin [Candidatus Saccharimonadaceae bacterium]